MRRKYLKLMCGCALVLCNFEQVVNKTGTMTGDCGMLQHCNRQMKGHFGIFNGSELQNNFFKQLGDKLSRLVRIPGITENETKIVPAIKPR